MKRKYIGRIKLSKEDSAEWYGNPPFMYVIDENKNSDRGKINSAILFDNKDKCIKALKKDFKKHGHEPSSKMEVITIELTPTLIEII